MYKNFELLLKSGDRHQIFLKGFFWSYLLLMGIAASTDWYFGNITDMYVELVFIALTLPLYFYYEISGNDDVGKYGLVILTALSTYMLLVTNDFQTSFFHIIMPLGFFLLFPFKKSMSYTMIHNIIVLIIYYLGYHYFTDTTNFPPDTILLGIFMATLFVLLFGVFYHLAVDGSYNKLKTFNTQNEALIKETQKLNETLEQRVEHGIREIQMKEQMLQEQARLVQMGEMISMIAHQWRQPLATITSAMMVIERNIEIGKYDFSSKEGREVFFNFLINKHEEINENIQYLSSTTDDFRNFFNPDTEKEIIYINTPIQKALKLILSSMYNSDIEVIIDLKSNKQCEIYANEVMQVFLNILKNASDALMGGKEGKKVIRVITYDTNTECIVEICDNGIGISNKVIEKVFDPYFTTKGEKIGTGLGLYMAKSIIEEHHYGKIEIESQKGRTCLILRFKTLN